MRVLVTGGRDYTDADEFWAVMDFVLQSSVEAAAKLGSDEKWTHLVHGAANGADGYADAWARENGIQPVACSALWEINGRSAGPIRNKAMADLLTPGDDLVIAFPGGRGTASMVAIAEAAGIEVVRSTEILEAMADAGANAG